MSRAAEAGAPQPAVHQQSPRNCSLHTVCCRSARATCSHTAAAHHEQEYYTRCYMTRVTHIVPHCLTDTHKKKKKHIAGCGNPFPTFTTHVYLHISNFAPGSHLGLRLYPRNSPGHSAEYLGEKVRPTQYHPHQPSRSEADTLRTARAAPRSLPNHCCCCCWSRALTTGRGRAQGCASTAQPTGHSTDIYFVYFKIR